MNSDSKQNAKPKKTNVDRNLRSSIIRAIQKQLEEIGLQGMIVTHVPHIRYLAGFSGSNALFLITKRKACLITDIRYREQAAIESADFNVHIAEDGSLTQEIARRRLLRNVQILGFEQQYIMYQHFKNAQVLFKPTRLKGCSKIIENFKAVKMPDEIAAIRQAAAISDRVFQDILGMIVPGVKEIELAAEISYLQKRYGAEGDAFDPIVLAGSRSAIIHGKPGDRTLKNGDLLLLDFGCKVRGYCCDMTRTVALGKISRDAKKIYSIVFDAQKKALESITFGMQIKALDLIARASIADRGYGEYFGHALGHGIGLEVHEEPKISSLNHSALVPGNVFTIEPGIYIPGFGGVRIEDTVVMRENGIEILTTSPKEMILL